VCRLHPLDGAVAASPVHDDDLVDRGDGCQATHDPRWLTEAAALQDVLAKRFADSKGGFYLTAEDDEALLAREKPGHDGAEPSGNSIAAMNLLRLAEFRSDEGARALAEKLLRAFAPQLEDGYSMPAMLSALDYALDRPLEVVIVTPTRSAAAALEEAQRRSFVPNRIFVLATEGDDLAAQSRLVPLLEGKRARNGNATAYVCRGKACDLPTSDPKTFVVQLARVEPLLPAPSPQGGPGGDR
jgi:hypothetical protein